MENLDLRLLMVFDEVYKSAHISRAAQNLGMGQPAISMGLRKLRAHFGDPLFVRTSRGMLPTPMAQGLIPYVRETLALLQTTLDYRTRFDPATSRRAFRVSMNDISQVVALPDLLRLAGRDAPSVRIDVNPVTQDTPRLLETGGVDLAIGFIPTLEAGFYQQKLLDEVFVCIARADHPRVGRRLTLRQFQAERHMVVSTVGTGHSRVEQTLDELGLQRQVALRVPNFTGLTANVENTDYLVVVPRRLGLFLQARGRVKVLALPFRLPGYQVMQHWHERYARDPGNRWLRGLVAGIFNK